MRKIPNLLNKPQWLFGICGSLGLIGLYLALEVGPNIQLAESREETSNVYAETLSTHAEKHAALEAALPQFMDVYTTPLLAQLARAEDFLAEAHAALEAAHASRRSEAFDLAEDSNRYLSEAIQLVLNVDTGFSDLMYAYEYAAISLESARHDVAGSAAILESIEEMHNLSRERSLADAWRLYDIAVRAMETAEKTAETIVEEIDTYDHVALYKESQNAIHQAEMVVIEGRQQVAYLQSAQTSIANLRNLLVRLQDERVVADANLATLRDNHARSIWAALQNNFDQTGNKIEQATALLHEAQSLLSNELLSNAADTVQLGLTQASTVEAVFTQAHNLRAIHEQYRSKWPSAENRALYELGEEWDDINNYGDYSWSAESDYEEAERLLSDAQDAADRREYELAVTLAERAAAQADGTGRRAYNAYQDHLEEEEAAARATSNSDNSDWGSSSPSSGWDYDSSGGGSDGGFFDNDGGGNDGGFFD